VQGQGQHQRRIWLRRKTASFLKCKGFGRAVNEIDQATLEESVHGMGSDDYSVATKRA
jgi:hypothetical protein